MKVIDGGFGKSTPNDLSRELRQMADDVDSGDISGMVVAYIHKGNYSFLFGTNIVNSIVLASLLQQLSIDRSRGQG